MQSQRYLELSEKIMLTFLSWDVFFIREKCPLPFWSMYITKNNNAIEL